MPRLVIAMVDSSDQQTFYLIDGHAQIFRAYYAIRGGMSSPVTGEPTHAVFTFASMLLKLFAEYRPAYVVMAIDTPGKTFRDELYDDYKGNREPPPDDFHPQEQRIFELTKHFGIPLLGIPGAEADDIIATLAERILQDPQYDHISIRIVSRDKDLEQLLSKRVCLFDIHKDEILDVRRLQEEKNIGPEQVVDLLALTGDAVDNIPGVVGIGPKTGSKLLHEYGSIEGILTNIEKIKGKRRENIEAAKDHLPLNQELVTLKRDVEIEFDLDQAKCVHDVPAIRQLFQTLGFRRHVRELEQLTATNTPGIAPAAATEDSLFSESLFGSEAPEAEAVSEPTVPEGHSTASSCDYRAVTTQPQLADLIKTLQHAPLISIDTETSRLGRRAKICGLAFSVEPGQGVYVPTSSPAADEHLDLESVLSALRDVLEDPARPKCGHNLKYDALTLRYAARGRGIRLRGIVFDSMIAAHLLGYASRSLDHLAAALLQHTVIPISQLIGPRDSKQLSMDEIALDQIVPYAAEDADMSLRLYGLLQQKLQEAGMQDLAAIEMPLVEVLADMEYNGIRLEPDELLRQKKALTGRIDQLRDKIFEAAGEPFNLDSPKQLADILFGKLGLPKGKRGKTGPSTDVEVLERLANREDLPPERTVVPRLIVEYRHLAKLVNTYLDNLRHGVHKDDGRIHAFFQQLGAATGRLSSGGPNLQNIPTRTEVGRRIRKAFVAEPGHLLICADYSQIELRILAHLSDDPALLEAFRSDMDIHTAVAGEVFGVPATKVTAEQRAHAKVVNFGIIYGVTPYGLARRIEGLDEAGAKILIADYRRRFAGIDRFLHQCVSQGLKNGYVKTMLGRRRCIAQLESRNPATRALGERLAINTVVQGSATGDLIKTAMVNLYRRIQRDNLRLKMLLQIHDELVLETPQQLAEENAQIVRREMEGAMQLKVPLKVDLGIAADWRSAK